MTLADYVISIQDCFYTGSSRIVCKNKSSKKMSQALNKKLCYAVLECHWNTRLKILLQCWGLSSSGNPIAQNNN